MKNIPIGLSSFMATKDRNYLYVDKTKEILFLTFHKSYTKRGLSSLHVVLRPVKKSLIPDSFYRF